MKKSILTLIAAFILFSYSNAQLTNSNATVTVYATVNDFVVASHVDIINNGSSSINVHCQRTSQTLAQSHESSFCWGPTCYPSTVSLSTTSVAINSGNTNSTFIGDLKPWGAAGSSTVCYRFFEETNTNNYTDLCFTYVIGLTSLNDADIKPTINVPRPNPADKFTALGYTLKGSPSQYKLEVFNMLGSKVTSFDFKEKNGLLIIPTDVLQSGIYFCSLKQNGKAVSTQKLVVAHK